LLFVLATIEQPGP